LRQIKKNNYIFHNFPEKGLDVSPCLNDPLMDVKPILLAPDFDK